MKKIEEIIKTIDNELIEKDKPYLLLAQANKLLVSKNIITISEKIDGTLKKLLEDNKIPHAFQTKKKPKQWVIPISDKGQTRKNNLPRQKIKSNHSQRKPKNENSTVCPECGINLLIPKRLINDNYLECSNCKVNFENPFYNKKNQKKKDNFPLTNKETIWVCGIILFLVIAFIPSKENSPTSLYEINATAYVTTSKASFDEMFQYIIHEDNVALRSLKLTGQLKVLSPGTNVYVISSHFTHCVIRLKGSSQRLWIATEFITKK